MRRTTTTTDGGPAGGWDLGTDTGQTQGTDDEDDDGGTDGGSSVVVRNDGTEPATVTALDWSCDHNLYLDDVSGCGPLPWEVAAGAAATLEVRWEHWDAGTECCTLTVHWVGDLTFLTESGDVTTWWDHDCTLELGDSDAISCSGLPSGGLLVEYARRPCWVYGD